MSFPILFHHPSLSTNNMANLWGLWGQWRLTEEIHEELAVRMDDHQQWICNSWSQNRKPWHETSPLHEASGLRLAQSHCPPGGWGCFLRIHWPEQTTMTVRSSGYSKLPVLSTIQPVPPWAVVAEVSFKQLRKSSNQLAYRIIVPLSSLQPFLVQTANLTLPQETESEVRLNSPTP